MLAVWISLKGNVNCGSKLTDVTQRGGERIMRRRSCTLDDDMRDELSVVDPKIQEAIFRLNCTRKNWFSVLEIGDPSRNIIEMIFKAALSNPSRHSRRIKEVLRVHNSIETLERFEKYRETVKNRSMEQYMKHTRSMVDGNEQLLFYSTTMSCCCTVQTSGVTKLCRDSACRVCRILQSGFSKANNGENGIRLSTRSEELNEAPNTKGKNLKNVVIICRVIAGRVVNMVERESEYDCDSVADGKLNYLLVKHSNAVLPCFVIVLK